jgi:hypothetical protein
VQPTAAEGLNVSSGKDFLAQSIAALEQLSQQRLDPARPDPTALGSQSPGRDWAAYLASPAGKAAVERLRSPELAWKPLLVLDGRDSQQVSDAFKAVSGALTPQKPKKAPARTKKTASTTPKPRRRPAPLPEVAHVETERMQYVYTVEATRTRRLTGTPLPAQPVPLFIQLNHTQGAHQPPTVTPSPFFAPLPTQPKPPEGFGPGQNLAIGGGLGAVTGAGLAYMLNAARHFAPDPVSQALFAIAGAAVGLGLGGLVGAKIVKAEDVTGPLLKMATGKA